MVRLAFGDWEACALALFAATALGGCSSSRSRVRAPSALVASRDASSVVTADRDATRTLTPMGCSALLALRQRRLDDARSAAQRTVFLRVAEGRDPLAPSRAAIVDELSALRARNATTEQLAAALRRLETRRDDDARRQFVQPTDVHPIGSELTEASCVEDARGAWLLIPDEIVFYPREEDWTSEWGSAQRLVVARVDSNGGVSTAEVRTSFAENGAPSVGASWPPLTIRFNCCDRDSGFLEEPAAFDFDGDGVKEFFVRSQWAHEATSFSWSALYTVRDGRIVTYPTPDAFEPIEMRDENDDGRPDLIGRHTVPTGIACGSGFETHASGPEFAAISRADGSFDTTGEAARAVALQACPTRPRQTTTFDEVICARLWGATVDELRRSMQRRYAEWSCEDEVASRPQRNRRAHREYDAMLAALDVPLPLVLVPRPSAQASRPSR